MPINPVFATRLPPSLPPEDIPAILSAYQTLNEKLGPHVVRLVPEERRQRDKMGPRSSDFVGHGLVYARQLPHYVPSFVPIEEYQRSWDTVATMTDLLHPLEQLHGMVEDTILLAGSQAKEMGLAVYEAASPVNAGLPRRITTSPPPSPPATSTRTPSPPPAARS